MSVILFICFYLPYFRFTPVWDLSAVAKIGMNAHKPFMFTCSIHKVRRGGRVVHVTTFELDIKMIFLWLIR